MTIKDFGDLQPGDVIAGSDGQPTQVVSAYDVHVPQTMYRIEFEEGKVIEASGNHLWYVETSLARSLHRGRVKNASNLLKKVLVGKILEDALVIADMDEAAEMSLSDLTNVFGDSPEMVTVLSRVAASVGHVSEENTTHQDMFTEEVVSIHTLRQYDARRVMQQLLALAFRKYRKKWPIVVGEVMTTEDMANLSLVTSIPDVRPL